MSGVMFVTERPHVAAINHMVNNFFVTYDSVCEFCTSKKASSNVERFHRFRVVAIVFTGNRDPELNL